MLPFVVKAEDDDAPIIARRVLPRSTVHADEAPHRVYSDGVDLTVAAPSGVVEFRRRWAVARSPAGVLV